eukprot:4258767-Amphidinium_carterae.2
MISFINASEDQLALWAASTVASRWGLGDGLSRACLPPVTAAGPLCPCLDLRVELHILRVNPFSPPTALECRVCSRRTSCTTVQPHSTQPLSQRRKTTSMQDVHVIIIPGGKHRKLGGKESINSLACDCIETSLSTKFTKVQPPRTDRNLPGNDEPETTKTSFQEGTIYFVRRRENVLSFQETGVQLGAETRALTAFVPARKGFFPQKRK